MKNLPTLLFGAFCLMACSKQPNVPEPKILSKLYYLTYSTNCDIQSVNLDSKVVSATQNCTSFRFLDFVIATNEGYGLKYDILTGGFSLAKIELSSQSILSEKKIPNNQFAFSTLENYGNQVILSYTTISSTGKAKSFIDLYDRNLETISPSIEMLAENANSELYLTATEVIDNKIFMGYREVGTTSKQGTLVFDLLTKTILKRLPFGSIEFLILNGKQKVASLSQTALTTIDTQTFEQGATAAVSLSQSVAQLPYNFMAYDSTNNLIFFLFPVSQPALRSHGLASFNPVTAAITRISNNPSGSIHPPIAFDSDRKLFIAGTQNGGSLLLLDSKENEINVIGVTGKLSKIH
jgi:hypothetical protein